MIPFCCSTGTSSDVTKILLELLLCALTFCGTPSGSNIKWESQLIWVMSLRSIKLKPWPSIIDGLFFSYHKKSRSCTNKIEFCAVHFIFIGKLKKELSGAKIA